MLLKDVIDIINKIEVECEKEIESIRFSDLTPYEITEIKFVPDYCCEPKEEEMGMTD